MSSGSFLESTGSLVRVDKNRLHRPCADRETGRASLGDSSRASIGEWGLGGPAREAAGEGKNGQDGRLNRGGLPLALRGSGFADSLVFEIESNRPHLGDESRVRSTHRSSDLKLIEPTFPRNNNHFRMAFRRAEERVS